MNNKSYSKHITICFSFILIVSLSYSQDFLVNANNKPIGELLIELKDQYGIQISVDESLLNTCSISLVKQYSSINLLMTEVLAFCNLTYQKKNEIFIIKKNKIESKTKKSKKKKYPFIVQIIDAESLEPLPFSYITIGSTNIQTNLDGNFTFLSEHEALDLEIRHISYFSKFLIIKSSTEKQILKLESDINEIKEVIVSPDSKKNEKLSINENSSLIKLNHKIASSLPGNSNNTIFNVLRLQAGILASGEPSKDFLIRGSYKGQTHILFDGITIFNTSNFDDRIGVFNTSIIKDIEVFKSGYQVDVGDRVAAVVKISSKTGSFDQFNANINWSNQALGAYVNLPFKGKSSLQVAARTSYPDLFKSETYTFKLQTKSNLFNDLNIKFASNFNNGDHLRISLLAQRDQFVNKNREEDNLRIYNNEVTTIQYQAGASATYNRKWKTAGNTSFIAAFSVLNTNYDNDLSYTEKLNSQNTISSTSNLNNGISEFSFKVNHHLPTTKLQDINMGLSYIYNQSVYNQDSASSSSKNLNLNQSRINFFIKDNFSLTKYLNIIAGLELDHVIGAKLPSFQPRIQAIIRPKKHWKINLTYGIYNQFINENSLLDQFGNRIYYWAINSTKDKALQSIHYLTGFSADYNFISFSAEAYYINTRNLNVFRFNKENGTLSTLNLKARTYGVDFHFKVKYKKHLIWFAYTVSQSEESLMKSKIFRPSDQDQLHEFKTALILNFQPFYASANYVFGSGFQDLGSYNRLDLALSYKYLKKKLKLEFGASLLNATNSKNIKFSNFSNFPNNKTIYQAALPITPNLFLNIKF